MIKKKNVSLTLGPSASHAAQRGGIKREPSRPPPPVFRADVARRVSQQEENACREQKERNTACAFNQERKKRSHCFDETRHWWKRNKTKAIKMMSDNNYHNESPSHGRHACVQRPLLNKSSLIGPITHRQQPPQVESGQVQILCD